jgi:peptidyl-prolyl cis-trans isomerase A (cyclophilin A)
LASITRRALALALFTQSWFIQARRPHRSRLLTPAKISRTAPEKFWARFKTTRGIFVVEVVRANAPLGSDRFYSLVRAGYYDGVRFFRTVPKFVTQFGLNPDPRVTKAWGQSTRITDDPVKESNLQGAVTFAAAGPNTRTTQIFINLADNTRLDKTGFAPFGKVVSGMDVVLNLYSGYGEGAPRGKGPDQKRIREEGEPYLAKDFPLLDRVTKARVTTSPVAAHATLHPH